MNERFKEKLLSSKITMKYFDEPFKPDLVFIAGSRLNGVHAGTTDYDLVVVSREVPCICTRPIHFIYHDMFGDVPVKRLVHWHYWPYDILGTVNKEEFTADFLRYTLNWKLATLCSIIFATLLDDDNVIKIYTPEGQAFYDNLKNQEYRDTLVKACMYRIMEECGIKEYCYKVINSPSEMIQSIRGKGMYRVFVSMCIYLNIEYNKDYIFNIKTNHIDEATEKYCVDIIKKTLNKYNNEK